MFYMHLILSILFFLFETITQIKDTRFSLWQMQCESFPELQPIFPSASIMTPFSFQPQSCPVIFLKIITILPSTTVSLSWPSIIVFFHKRLFRPLLWKIKAITLADWQDKSKTPFTDEIYLIKLNQFIAYISLGFTSLMVGHVYCWFNVLEKKATM